MHSSLALVLVLLASLSEAASYERRLRMTRKQSQSRLNPSHRVRLASLPTPRPASLGDLTYSEVIHFRGDSHVLRRRDDDDDSRDDGQWDGDWNPTSTNQYNGPTSTASWSASATASALSSSFGDNYTASSADWADEDDSDDWASTATASASVSFGSTSVYSASWTPSVSTSASVASSSAVQYNAKPKPTPSPVGVAAECTALAKVWSDMGGATWKNATGWTTPASNCCTWFGVSCDHNGHVRSLKLPNNELNWSMSSALFLLPELQELDLSSNHISGDIPDQFGQLQALSMLSLEVNSLSGSLPGSLVYAQALQNVFLGNNSLSGVLQFPSALNLTQLRATNNAFSTFSPGNLTVLREVSIDNNAFTGPLPVAESMPLLEKFTASGCGFTGDVFDLAALPGLQRLDLRNNQLTGAFPDPSANPDLTFLALSGNQFSGAFPSAEAPAGLATCLADPVSKGDCPPNALSDKASLASKCNVKCKGTSSAVTTGSHELVRVASSAIQLKAGLFGLGLLSVTGILTAL